ncbi:putative membrane-bound protein [Wenxinia marina DSM 24838]|uniref:Putative membrane-bound protein n=1 Tax=Wenxinia marina DSM 24838 TaxID=1123501 RepID=A0A0D0QFN7_9RHOB|nr:putative membrane-bound protein [Wenxinia marina DSM 24838]
MLWSLLKILVFVAVVIAVTLGAIYLTTLDGGAVVQVAGLEFTLGPLELVIGFIVLVILVWIALKVLGFLVALLRFINGDETSLSRYFTRNRERKGIDALADGMLALAAGEGNVALLKAERADRLLDRPSATNLLKAQAADMIGDRARAEAAYKALIAEDRTRFVGIRGILQHKLADGDDVTALKLAAKAFELKPAHPETQDTLMRLQAESHDWAGARRTLGAKLKHGTLPKDVYKRRDAVLALSEAKEVFEEGATIEAREEAIEANRLSPDLIPGAVMAARGYIEKGNTRYATRILKKAWEVQPHPDLAAAFAEIAPNESAAARKSRFQALTRLHPANPETRMLAAELEIAAEDFPAARRALGDLNETDPTARSLTLMAAIERGMGADEAVVRGWLTRALTAPRGPQWICDNCQQVHANWMPVCSNCHGFDTLSWRRPPHAEVAMPRLDRDAAAGRRGRGRRDRDRRARHASRDLRAGGAAGRGRGRPLHAARGRDRRRIA